MSTRSVIARATGGEGEFKGVYHHSDGYPTGLGKHLVDLLRGRYRGDLKRMLTDIIDKHSAGWSCLIGESSECYCHPKRPGRKAEPQANWFTHENSDGDIEWVYIFDEDNQRLFVRDNRNDAEEIVDLNGPEPDWVHIECGQDLERCSHCTWVHFPEVRGTSQENLSTAIYLGKRDFVFHDAIAVLVNGKRYRLTGSGFSFGYCRSLSRLSKIPQSTPDNAWISSVISGNGRRMDMPTALLEAGGGYKPYPGVSWVFPPTKVIQEETIRQ